MKAFVVILALCAAVNAADEFCYKDVVRSCSPTASKQITSGLTNCNARYGAIAEVQPDLQAYANSHISRSFEYLLMSTHFANYEKNRKGFEKLFRDLSDSKWSQAIELIKYITKRGGQMDFNYRKEDTVTGTDNANYELYELESLGKALDMEKAMALEAHSIHGEATRRRPDFHDPEISAYLEEEFVHKHAKKIRELSGHASDLSGMLKGPDSSLALFLFDEYLQKN